MTRAPLPGSGSRVAGARTRTANATAARFAIRARRRRRRRIGILLLCLGVLSAACWVVFGSRWFSVHTVTVVGAQRIPVEVIRAAAGIRTGQAMVFTDTAGPTSRVSALPLVSTAVVQRVWPDGIVITVRERQPVAAVPSDGGVLMVDRDAVVIEKAGRSTATLPLLDVDLAHGGARALDAALDVYLDLPKALRSETKTVGASSGDAVWLVLVDGSRVIWGSADADARKVEVLAALRAQHTKGRLIYDVSAPGAPAVTGQ